MWSVVRVEDVLTVVLTTEAALSDRSGWLKEPGASQPLRSQHWLQAVQSAPSHPVWGLSASQATQVSAGTSPRPGLTTGFRHKGVYSFDS